MLRLDWASENHIGEIKKPILFVCGTIDKLCPMAMTNELHEAAVKSENKEMFIVPNGDHNNTFIQAGPDYFIRLRRFMKNCLGEGDAQGELITEMTGLDNQEEQAAGSTSHGSKKVAPRELKLVQELERRETELQRREEQLKLQEAEFQQRMEALIAREEQLESQNQSTKKEN